MSTARGSDDSKPSFQQIVSTPVVRNIKWDFSGEVVVGNRGRSEPGAAARDVLCEGRRGRRAGRCVSEPHHCPVAPRREGRPGPDHRGVSGFRTRDETAKAPLASIADGRCDMGRSCRRSLTGDGWPDGVGTVRRDVSAHPGPDGHRRWLPVAIFTRSERPLPVWSQDRNHRAPPNLAFARLRFALGTICHCVTNATALTFAPSFTTESRD
jgi:hypothetical protein